MLTYNVAGLPLGLSSADPATNSVLISPLLNPYGLVLVQEDFGYHDDIASAVTLPFASTPLESTGIDDSIGDGLNRFSQSSFDDHQRIEWAQCSGFVTGSNDCLTRKGFSVARHMFGPGRLIDVYNAHFDAGRGDADHDTRGAQVAQLVAFMDVYSAGAAVILAGDTNMKDDDEDTFTTLLTTGELTDACRSLSCSDIYLIDRVLFRSSADIAITATTWSIASHFVDDDDEPLSDHDAISATLHIEGAAN